MWVVFFEGLKESRHETYKGREAEIPLSNRGIICEQLAFGGPGGIRVGDPALFVSIHQRPMAMETQLTKRHWILGGSRLSRVKYARRKAFERDPP